MQVFCKKGQNVKVSVSRTGVRLGEPEAGPWRFGGEKQVGVDFLGLGVSRGGAPLVLEKAGRVGLGFAKTETYCMFFQTTRKTMTLRYMTHTYYQLQINCIFFSIFLLSLHFYRSVFLLLLHNEPSLVCLLIELQSHFCFEWNSLLPLLLHCTKYPNSFACNSQEYFE